MVDIDIYDGVKRFQESAVHWWRKWDGPWQAAGSPPPFNWEKAIATVSSDLNAGLLSGIVDFDFRDSTWHLFISPHNEVMVELHVSRDSKDSGFISTTEPTEANCTVEDAILWTARLVQDDLTGYHHIEWPEIGGRIFEPRLIDGRPCWADRGNIDAEVFEVGRLKDAASA